MAGRNEVTGNVLANVKGDAEAYADGWDRIFGKLRPGGTFLSEDDPRRGDVGIAVIDSATTSEFCRKCGGAMRPGKAIEQTWVGRPDFPGDMRGVTMSPGGSGELVDCLKCELCGWSVTPLTPTKP